MKTTNDLKKVKISFIALIIVISLTLLAFMPSCTVAYVSTSDLDAPFTANVNDQTFENFEIDSLISEINATYPDVLIICK